MPRCLNPKKSHENRSLFARTVSSSATVALSEAQDSAEEEQDEEQVACQFCKYLLEGALLGDCRIIRWIGSGSFGDVYEAEQLPPLSRRVAIKVMSMERVVDGQSAELFAREVSTIAALDHPNILPVLRAGIIEDGRSYLVMKYAAQGSLQQFCQPPAPAFALSMLPTRNEETPPETLAIATIETLNIMDEQSVATHLIPQTEPEICSSTNSDENREQTAPALEPEPGAEPAEAAETLSLQAEKPQEPEQDAEEPIFTETAEAMEETRRGHNSPQQEASDQEPIANQEPPETPDTTERETSDQPPVQETYETDEALVATPEIPIEREATVVLQQNVTLLAPTAAHLPQTSGVTVLSAQQVLRYVEEAASALHYAHEHGLIHLDVKPANLLLDAQGRLLLADFGVSVLLEDYTHASLHYYVGTPLYTAPEQWLEQPRPASDQYALAVTCYQLLTGRPPFTGNLYAVMHGHLQAQPPSMSELNPLIPQEIEAVLRRALAKDPTARYPDILAFARAYHEALENAASADTDTQMQKRAILILEMAITPQVDVSDIPLAIARLEEIDEQTFEVTETKPDEVGTFKKKQTSGTDWEAPDDKQAPKQNHWLRNLVLLLLSLLLICSGSLGFVRTVRPCWIGICPGIGVNTSPINFTNDETQKIKITNDGNSDLNWNAWLVSPYSWIKLVPTSGTIAPGQSGTLTISTQVDALPGSGIYGDAIEIAGGTGVVIQSIRVTENVVKGLEAVSVKTSGQTFLYEQGKLQPQTQTITLTNQSGHTLSWYTQYTDNNWLAVTPSQGSLANGKSVILTATVTNPQALSNDTYQVRFSLVGKLDTQSDFTLFQPIDFNLQVSQTAIATPAIVLPSPTPQVPLSFTAQPVVASGPPTVQRSGHSIVWDNQDGQMLVFGGIDNQGNLLNDLWSYTPGTNKWAELSSPNTSATDCSGSSPAPRMNAAMVWDSADQQILLYGGQGTDGSYLGDLWSFAPTRGTWNAIACSGNGPGSRAGPGVTWNGSQMLILGGQDASGLLSDFWSYTPGTSGWNQISATTPLGTRAFPTVAWDTKEKQMYVFGGLIASGQQTGDFYVYQPGTGWNSITPGGSGDTPLARQQALGTWDSKDNVFLLMGGWQTGNSTTYSAMWAYSPSKNEWWQITSLQNTSSTSVIPSRSASMMVWDSADNRAYVYAGTGGPGKADFNDLWMIIPG
jgi:serine/threonine protein kinase/N-acetylneuraminic acid mutarotase